MAIPTNFRDSSPLSTMFNIQNTPFEISIQLRETSALYSIFIPDICICMESIVSTIIENLIRWKLNYLSRRFVSNSIRILLHRASIGGFTVRAGSRRARNAFHTIAHIFLFACNLHPRYFLEIMKMGMRYIFSIPMGREGNEWGKSLLLTNLFWY